MATDRKTRIGLFRGRRGQLELLTTVGEPAAEIASELASCVPVEKSTPKPPRKNSVRKTQAVPSEVATTDVSVVETPREEHHQSFTLRTRRG